MIKVLYIGFQHAVVRQLIQQLKLLIPDIITDALIFDNSFNEKSNSSLDKWVVFKIKYNHIFRLPVFKQLYYFYKLVTTVLLFKDKYDVVHFVYFDYRYYFILPIIKLKSKRQLISIVGSDYERMNSFQRFFLLEAIKKCDSSNCQNSEIVNRIILKLGNKRNKIKTIVWGLQSLVYLKKVTPQEVLVFKEKYRIPTNCIVITCGANNTESQQHVKIIDAVNSIKNAIKGDFLLIFPFSYGISNDAYLRNIENQLLDFGLKGIFIKNYITNEEIAILRYSSDIYINIQLTDALSGTMQESLFANNIVITGSWLPYNQFDELGIVYQKIDSYSELGNRIIYCIDNMIQLKQECKVNRQLIWDLSSWEKNIDHWINLYK